MHIKITAHTSKEGLQLAFTEVFPYLRLEFSDNTNAGEHMYATDITGDMTVEEVEAVVTAVFGSAAQILRKTGTLWVETGKTKEWTLDRQSAHAREIARPTVSMSNTERHSSTQKGN